MGEPCCSNFPLYSHCPYVEGFLDARCKTNQDQITGQQKYANKLDYNATKCPYTEKDCDGDTFLEVLQRMQICHVITTYNGNRNEIVV
jgi:hypothetical protein